MIDDVVLFLAPFTLFGLFLLLRGRRILDPAQWRGAASWLAIGGVLLVLGGVAIQYLRTPPQFGAYAPARIENGRLVPGQFVPERP